MPDESINLPPAKEGARASRPPLKGEAKRAMRNSRSITWGDLKKVAGYLGVAITIAGAILTYGVTKGASAEKFTTLEKTVTELQTEFSSFKKDMDAKWQKNDDFAARMERSMGTVEGYLRKLGDK